MRKEDVASYIVYLLMVIIAVVIGFTVLRNLVAELDSATVPFKNSLIFSVVMVLSAIVFNALIIELGHLVGAKIGGYTITFFNVLWFTFYKKEGKTKFGFRNYDGLTGETKILPKKANANPKAYVWFPILFYIVELIAVIITFSAVLKINTGEKLSWIIVAVFIFACVGGLIVLYDYVPFRLDSMTDGYRLTLLGKKINTIAFNQKLILEDAEFNGKEIPDIQVYDEITDFTASINLIKVYQLLDELKYDEAEELLSKIIADPKLINAETHNNCEAELVYIHLMRDEVLKGSQYYANINSVSRKAISETNSMQCIRAYLLVSGIVEKSRAEMNYAISKKNKALRREPKGRVELETKLFANAVQRVKEVEPSLFEEK